MEMELNRKPAIEVVTMFEDAIVDARHFADPGAGSVRRGTQALIAGGAVALGLALVTFLVAYAQVAGEKARGGAVSTGGVVFDVLATLLVAGGLGALVSGLLRLHDERRPRDFTIGSDARALFHTADAALANAGSFPLLHSTGSDYELLFTPAMRGDVSFGGHIVSLGDLVRDGRARPAYSVPGAYALALGEGARAKIDFGDASVLLRPVSAPHKNPVPLSVDGQALGFTGGVTMVALALLAVMFSIPADMKSLSLDNTSALQRIATFNIKPPEDKVEPMPAWLAKAAPEAGGRSKAHKGPPGKMGNPKARAATGRYQLQGPKNNPNPQLAHDYAAQVARNSGVLAVLKNSGGPFSSVFSNSESAIGSDANTVLGGLTGTQVAEAYGVPGGLGIVGHEKGGDWGPGMGTVGNGRIGTSGIGAGSDPYKHGIGNFRDHKVPHGPELIVGVATARGGMDKDIIRRVIRQHVNEIKFCYDQQLMKNADLWGRVVVQFTINANGQVISSAVQSSTMNDMGVEQCVAGTLRRFEFPKPQGGGIVMVSYPFAFNRPGQQQ